MLAMPSPTASIDAWSAWSDYRSKQENIVEYLLYICEQDKNLTDFVHREAWQAIQSKLHETAAGGEIQLPAGQGKAATESPAAFCGEMDLLQSMTASPQWMTPVANCLPTIHASLKLSEHLPVQVEAVSEPPSCQTMVKIESEVSDGLALLARLMEDDSAEKAKNDKNVEMLERIMSGPDDLETPIRRRNRDEPSNGMQTSANVTVVLGAQNLRLTSAYGMLELLRKNYDVVGGRDIDFLYCPTDFGKPFIKGYAIINFRDAEKAEAMATSGPDCSWAKMQGKARNTEQFLKRHSHVRSARFRPLIWPNAIDTEPISL